jgi:hypothetical protein
LRGGEANEAIQTFSIVVREKVPCLRLGVLFDGCAAPLREHGLIGQTGPKGGLSDRFAVVSRSLPPEAADKFARFCRKSRQNLKKDNREGGR